MDDQTREQLQADRDTVRGDAELNRLKVDNGELRRQLEVAHRHRDAAYDRLLQVAADYEAARARTMQHAAEELRLAVLDLGTDIAVGLRAIRRRLTR